MFVLVFILLIMMMEMTLLVMMSFFENLKLWRRFAADFSDSNPLPSWNVGKTLIFGLGTTINR